MSAAIRYMTHQCFVYQSTRTVSLCWRLSPGKHRPWVRGTFVIQVFPHEATFLVTSSHTTRDVLIRCGVPCFLGGGAADNQDKKIFFFKYHVHYATCAVARPCVQLYQWSAVPVPVPETLASQPATTTCGTTQTRAW